MQSSHSAHKKNKKGYRAGFILAAAKLILIEY